MTTSFLNGALFALHFAGKFFVLPLARLTLWTVTAVAATVFVVGVALLAGLNHTTEAVPHDDTTDTVLATGDDSPIEEGVEAVAQYEHPLHITEVNYAYAPLAPHTVALPPVADLTPNLLRWVDVSRITHQLGKALSQAAKQVTSDSSLPHDLEALRDIARRAHMKGWNLFKDATKLRNKLIEGGVTA